ncbi:AbrB/MazE/SpoVT family DNA-binding domain-containing protein [Methanobacterium arcticum]|nr:AbrB/MazE/SpoVT family DNA-binding domain-containing protein [Methanobacterium arcticum]
MKKGYLYTIHDIGLIMILKYESTVGKADVKGKSSRVIIPREIVKMLGLEWGDKLIWNADIGDKGVTITVKAAKEDEK